jgi:hypothetical protein
MGDMLKCEEEKFSLSTVTPKMESLHAECVQMETENSEIYTLLQEIAESGGDESFAKNGSEPAENDLMRKSLQTEAVLKSEERLEDKCLDCLEALRHLKLDAERRIEDVLPYQKVIIRPELGRGRQQKNTRNTGKKSRSLSSPTQQPERLNFYLAPGEPKPSVPKSNDKKMLRRTSVEFGIMQIAELG